jgi:CheY-like chemotaxis protein/HPt (histidine-containing phosphotransfer) domain-containing protein
MNAVIGMTELAMDTALSDEQRGYLETVHSSAHALLDLLNDILDFSKIEARKLDLESVDFSLCNSLGETLKTLAIRADQKGLELACHIRTEVPDTLIGDPSRLRQILVNLVGNAIKFTERGEVIVTVGLEAPAAEGQAELHFAVRDTGIGIPREKQGLIFETFAQADGSMTRRYGGTGLGLAICSQLVGLMGGRIWVESQPGQGSTFHFTASFRIQENPSAGVCRLAPASLRGLPVLVVDDNAANRRILQEMLTQWGMLPVLADSGATALAELERARDAGRGFPLVLTDAAMPEMDGFMLAQQIKLTPDFAATAIIMLTSAGRRGDAARCRDLGVAAYLPKPVSQSDLLDAIVTVLGGTPEDRSPRSLVTRHTLRENRPRFRILVAEDNAVNQKLAVRILENWGHAAAVVGNGREALAALDAQGFDLVLMDVQMPEMDGFEATAASRRREAETGRRIPIIAMTAHAMKGDRERCLEAGMDAYVSKPIGRQALAEAIERVTGGGAGTSTPSPARQGETPANVVDLDEAVERLGGDIAFLEELMALLLEDVPHRLDNLHAAVDTGDVAAARREAHTIKGAAANVGAAAIRHLAARIELVAKESDLKATRTLLSELDEQFRRLQAHVAQTDWAHGTPPEPERKGRHETEQHVRP